MKILYIGNYAGPDSPLGHCPNAFWIGEAFKKAGHSLKGINECDYTPDEALSVVKEFKPDLVLLEEGRLKGDHWNDEKRHLTVIEGHIKRVMDECGVPCVSWLTNIFWGIMRREEEIKTNPIFKADIVFSTDGGHQDKFEEAGINHVLLRQGIHEPEAYIGKPIFPTTAEVGFVGSVYSEIWPYRAQLIDWLKATYGARFQHFGQRGEIRHDDLNNLCATLKIVVGDSVKSPHYWSNRIYEILGRGGFLIHPMTEGLDQEFKPYEHFVPYNYGDFKGLKEKIDYYLTHDEEREKIRMAGFEYCRKTHTYQKRVEEMMKILKERNII